MKVKRIAVISYHTCPLSDEEYQKASKHVFSKVQDLSWERVSSRFITVCGTCKP
jgi:hypothetical protein